MSRGFRARRREGERLRDSRTEGRKGSMRMSMWGISERRRAWPEGDLASMAMEVLCRVRRSGVGWGGGRVGELEWEWEWEVEEGRSTRRTVAPLSARRRPQKGPVVGIEVLVEGGMGCEGRGENDLGRGRRTRGRGDRSAVVGRSLL